MNLRHPSPHLRQPRRLPCWRGASGLTLIELLMGLLLMSVVLTIAVPSFKDFGKRTRLDIHVSDLESALNYARSEAARRGVRVAVCSSRNWQQYKPRCAAKEGLIWADTRGWVAFVDHVHVAGNDPGQMDGDDVLLRSWDPAPGSDTTRVSHFGSYFAFSPQGRVFSDTAAGDIFGGLEICQEPYGRKIVLNGIGRVTVTKVAC